MRLRLLIGALGVAAGLFGALRLLQLPFSTVKDAVFFLVGGVVVHDGVVAPLTIGLTVLGTRVLPRPARKQVTLGLVVLLTVTLSALPAILRLGARPDNTTLLDRNYLLGWLALAAVVLLGTLVAGPLLDRAHRRPAPAPATAGAGSATAADGTAADDTASDDTASDDTVGGA